MNYDLKFILLIIAAIFLIAVTFENLYKAFSSSLSYSHSSAIALGNVLT